MANIIVKDVAGLNAALKSAQAGDTIKLAAGDYTAFSLSGIKFGGAGVTITSLDANNEAKLNGFELRGCEGLTFKGLEMIVDATKANPYSVLDSARIKFDDVNVHGSLDGNAQNDSMGLMIRRSDGVTVVNSEFQQLEFGISNQDSKNIKIDGNKFHDIQCDGVRFGGTSNVTIANNSFSDFHPEDGDHPDAIQFWTTGTTVSATGITITGNVVMRGGGEAFQGIFFRDQVGGLPFKNVTISDNIVVGGAYNGIKVNGAEGLTITNNTVAAYADQPSSIGVEFATNARVTGNTSTSWVIEDTNTGLTQSSNTTIAVQTDGGKAVLSTYFASHPLSPLNSLLSAYFISADSALTTMNLARQQAVTITGTTAADRLSVNEKVDTRIEGGAGNDLITGGGIGHNTLLGGAGDDTFRVNSEFDQVVEDAGAGYDAVIASIDYAMTDNVEKLTLIGEAREGKGNALDNLIVGSEGSDTLSAMAGSDTIKAGLGDDRVYAGDGNDTLYGEAGNDTLSGGEGSDRLRGDEGNDSLAGGGGADTLMGSEGVDSFSGGAGADQFQFSEGDFAGKGEIIFDFSRTDGDRISVSGIDANTNVTGNQAFTFIGTTAFSKVAGQLRYEVSGSDSYFSGDANGDGLADFTVCVKGHTSLQSADFLL